MAGLIAASCSLRVLFIQCCYTSSFLMLIFTASPPVALPAYYLTVYNSLSFLEGTPPLSEISSCLPHQPGKFILYISAITEYKQHWTWTETVLIKEMLAAVTGKALYLRINTSFLLLSQYNADVLGWVAFF